MLIAIGIHHHRRAFVFVLVVLLVPAFLGFVAFAIDLGSIRVVRIELQNAADSAVLSGVYDLRGADADDWTAETSAVDFLEMNPVLGHLLGNLTYNVTVDVGEVQVNAYGTDPEFWVGGAENALRVTIQYEHHYSDFAQFLGFSSRVVSATATAGLVTRRPIAFWRLGQIVGITAVDETGNHDGVYVDDVELGVTGVFPYGDSAAGFDGVGAFIEVPHSDDFLLDSGAVSLWFKTENANAGIQSLFSKGSSGHDTGGNLDIRLNDEHVKVKLQSTAFSYVIRSGNHSTPPGSWHHVVVSFGADGLKLFVNGSEADSDPYTGGLGISSGGAGNYEPITIGVGLEGRIDEVAIYDRGVSRSEAQWLFEAVIDGDVAVGAMFWDGMLRF